MRLFLLARVGSVYIPLAIRNAALSSTRARGLHRLAISGSSTHLAGFRLYTTTHIPSAGQYADAPEELVLSDSQRRTIYALSTPPGKAGVAIVRVSGPDVLQVYEQMIRPYRTHHAADSQPEPWRMERCRISHPDTAEPLDDGLAVYFKAPKSFTTEDVLELHIHSGRAIITAILSALSHVPQCRPAEPGEFTRRAFEGGRLDLTQVEGLKDLVDAETESQRRMALRVAVGANRAAFDELRSSIVQCLAMVEALIDFGEGEDLEVGVYKKARESALTIRHQISSYLRDKRRGEILRSGIRVAIYGPPNAGKSSLLNFLAQREAAIVTPVPGTTRDILELTLDIGGLPVIIADTAGLRKTEDIVEQIGVERAMKTVDAADVSICVLSLPEAIVATPEGLRLQIPPAVALRRKAGTFFLLNKMDISSLSTEESSCVVSSAFPNAQAWLVSLNTGEGTANFLRGFAQALQDRYDIVQDSVDIQSPLITHARHRIHLQSAMQFVDAFLATAPTDIVLAAEELRYAAQAVGKVTGLIDIEDVLDAIFHEFCIGK